jgi:hypothetical protein
MLTSVYDTARREIAEFLHILKGLTRKDALVEMRTMGLAFWKENAITGGEKYQRRGEGDIKMSKVA